jgi:hypothetical protein
MTQRGQPLLFQPALPIRWGWFFSANESPPILLSKNISETQRRFGIFFVTLQAKIKQTRELWLKH